MKIAGLIFSICFAIAGIAGITNIKAEEAQVKFEKERLEYKVRFKDFFDITIGEMSLACDSGMLDGKEVYVAECTLKGKYFDFLNYFKSHIDKEKMIPLACEEEFVEKKEKELYIAIFDHQTKKVTVYDKIKNLQTEKEISNGIQDAVSIFYWLRSQKFEEKEIDTLLYSRNKLHQTKFVIEKKDEYWMIKSKERTEQKIQLDCMLLDAAKVPIKIEFYSKIGKFVAEKSK